MRIWCSTDGLNGKPVISILHEGSCQTAYCWSGPLELVQDVMTRLSKIPRLDYLKNPNALCVSVEFPKRKVVFVAHALNYSRIISLDLFLAIPPEDLSKLTTLNGLDEVLAKIAV